MPSTPSQSLRPRHPLAHSLPRCRGLRARPILPLRCACTTASTWPHVDTPYRRSFVKWAGRRKPRPPVQRSTGFASPSPLRPSRVFRIGLFSVRFSCAAASVFRCAIAQRRASMSTVHPPCNPPCDQALLRALHLPDVHGQARDRSRSLEARPGSRTHNDDSGIEAVFSMRSRRPRAFIATPWNPG